MKIFSKFHFLDKIKVIILESGAIAQLVEHLHGMQGGSGSSPLGSINPH